MLVLGFLLTMMMYIDFPRGGDTYKNTVEYCIFILFHTMNNKRNARVIPKVLRIIITA